MPRLRCVDFRQRWCCVTPDVHGDSLLGVVEKELSMQLDPSKDTSRLRRWFNGKQERRVWKVGLAVPAHKFSSEERWKAEDRPVMGAPHIASYSMHRKKGTLNILYLGSEAGYPPRTDPQWPSSSWECRPNASWIVPPAGDMLSALFLGGDILYSNIQKILFKSLL